MNGTQAVETRVVIRPLTPADAAAYIAIRREMLADSPWAFCASPEDDVALDATELSRKLAASPDPTAAYAIIGAFDDAGLLLGVAGINRPRQAKLAHRAHVWGVYVTPNARGRANGGVAKRIVAAALDLARTWPGVCSAGLSVSENSLAARRLYEALGFIAWGTEPDMLRTGGRSYAELHMLVRL